MEFLYSNFLPLKTEMKSFHEAFYDWIPKADELNIAVGYITADSLMELQNIVEVNKNRIKKLNLTIGMHYFDKFTEMEYQAAMCLDKYLHSNEMGQVRLVNVFRFHGKMYSYSKEGVVKAGIIGSNNLSSIIDANVRVYEAAILTSDCGEAKQIYDFITKLNETSTEIISNMEIHTFKKLNPILEDQEAVDSINNAQLAECRSKLTALSFEIPVKATKKHRRSNLNVFFGKGRKDKRGFVKPRHWYEVELIVSKEVTSKMGYPQVGTPEATFDVITDDGWKFRCKISGDYSKNFRSENDLKILGKWLKGRLEMAGALKVGELATEDTLKVYGRNTFTFTKTTIPGVWYLDFGVRK
jgi:hypothetical protein